MSPDPATITGIGAVPFKEFSSNQNKLHFKEKIRITKATLDLIQKKNKYKVGGIKKELVLDVNKSVNIYNNDTTTISNNKESNNKEYIVLLCSGMLSNCIIDELFPFVKDKHTLLDFGSVFDIFINDSRIVRRSVVKDENLRRVRRLYTKDWIF